MTVKLLSWYKVYRLTRRLYQISEKSRTPDQALINVESFIMNLAYGVS
jgi:hypothetical protein